MNRRTISLGNLVVTGNRVIIGDANFPPRGTEIGRVPNGEYPVSAIAVRVGGGEHIESFSMGLNGGGTNSEVVAFSIDGGVVAIADPAVKVPQRWLERRRRRRAVYRQIMDGLKGVPPRLYYGTLATDSGNPWAVVFYSGDGIFDVHVRRTSDGWVTALHGTLESK